MLLYANLVIIVAAAIGLYVYFSINPFSEEEITKLQDIVLKNVNQSFGHFSCFIIFF